MPRYMSSDDIRTLLSARIDTVRDGRPKADSYPIRTQRLLAEELGVSQGFLSQFLSGQRPHPTGAMLVNLGFDTQPFYRKKE